MDNFSLSKFMYETVACGATNQLPVSSVCNARCLFCSNKMNPFKIHRVGFRPLEDVKKGIALLSPQPVPEIRIGDSLPGRISEGEALLHPDIFEILRLVREKNQTSVIQVSTNGTMLTRKFIEKLKPFQPLKVTISYHSNTPRNWRRIFNLKEDKYKTASDSFFLLLKEGFLIEVVIVPLPKLVGYPDIEDTLKYLRPFTKDVIIFPPGYSAKAPPSLRKILDSDYSEMSRFFTKMRKKYLMNLCLMTDPLKPLNFDPRALMLETYKARFSHVLWLFSEAAYGHAKKILGDHDPYVPNEHSAFMVKNHTYGGNIICAGLLMIQDYRKAIRAALKKSKKEKIALLILPKISFDRFGDDLLGENYSRLSSEFGVPVWVR